MLREDSEGGVEEVWGEDCARDKSGFFVRIKNHPSTNFRLRNILPFLKGSACSEKIGDLRFAVEDGSIKKYYRPQISVHVSPSPYFHKIQAPNSEKQDHPPA